MLKLKKTIGPLAIVLVLTLLAACGPSNAEPTVDINAVYTQAAETVSAQLTLTALVMPSATLPPTATVPLPTLPPIVTTAPTLGIGTTFPTLPLPGVKTATPPTSGSVEVQWISNEPADNALVLPGAKFDIIWTVQNIGKRTWDTTFYVQHMATSASYLIAEKSIYNIRETVAPGAQTRIIIDGIAPSTPGTYYSWWKVKDPTGANIGDLDITIQVVSSTDPTATSVNPDVYCCPWMNGTNPHAAEAICVNWRAACNTCASEVGDKNCTGGCSMPPGACP